MAERPMLMSAPMVRAILDGTKTQTRRVAKKMVRHPDLGNLYTPGALVLEGEPRHVIERACPYGRPGDQLWVRETFQRFTDDGAILYKADPADLEAMNNLKRDECLEARWRPAIHMPRWASRITLEITGVRVERLQGISAEDSRREGAAGHPDGPWHAYRSLWTLINGPESWEANPWVWVIEFRRITP